MNDRLIFGEMSRAQWLQLKYSEEFRNNKDKSKIIKRPVIRERYWNIPPSKKDLIKS